MKSENPEISGLVSHIQIEFYIINIVAFFLQGNAVFVFEKTHKKIESIHWGNQNSNKLIPQITARFRVAEVNFFFNKLLL